MVKIGPRKRSQPSIQPFFNVFQTFSIVIPGKQISSKSYIYHSKMNFLKEQFDELAIGLPPIFSD
jgi:hypothetical protein